MMTLSPSTTTDSQHNRPGHLKEANQPARLHKAITQVPPDPIALPEYLSLLDKGISIPLMDSVDWASASLVFSGREPHVFRAILEHSVELDQCLPKELPIVRSIKTPVLQDVLCEGDGYHLHITCTSRRVKIMVSAQTLEVANQVGQSIYDSIYALGTIELPSSVLVDFLRISSGSSSSSYSRRINVPSWHDIKSNYPPQVRSRIASLHDITPKRLDDQGARLIVWHGPPGTGKTYAIRSLVSKWRKWCNPEILLNPEQLTFNPDSLEDIVLDDNKSGPNGRPWRLLIIEDADALLKSRTFDGFKTPLDHLLNLTDGMLGQGTKVIILLTTNAKVSNLPPALVRPGRCLSLIEFAPFTARQAREWLGQPVCVTNGGATLARLFELRSGLPGVSESANSKVGQYV